MKTSLPESSAAPMEYEEINYDELVERVDYDFGLSRRSFVKVLGAGLMIAVTIPVLAQESGQRGRGDGARNLGARIHIGKDGTITVLTGKVEGGQGSRTELSQAAAEELGVPLSRIQMLMADTASVPDDGGTYGSGTTPRTVPTVRRAAAAARSLLLTFASQKWQVELATLKMRDGNVVDATNKKSLSYSDLANSDEAGKLFEQSIPSDVQLTTVKEWKVLGTLALRPNARDVVVGAHKYPSDIARPGMLYGKILRAPTYGAKLVSIDLAPAKAMKNVVAVQDDQFVGVAAPNSFLAEKALEAISESAKWSSVPQPSSSDLSEYLKQNAQGGAPKNPYADELAGAKVVRLTYHVPYIQHAPLEPRAAVAEWADGKLTVWTGSQNPFGVRTEIAGAFHIPQSSVHVLVPDFGGGFGGKHSGECAIEAARLAKAAEKPVSLRWTREEEFTWAYFRPGAVIEAEASLDSAGKISTWHFISINPGPSGVDSPYVSGKKNCHALNSKPALRHGSYRGLAATANNFAREIFMDELAAAASVDPLEFRLAQLDNPRLRDVLEKAAKEFKWSERAKKKNSAIGLACGTEKGSYVAACVEVEIDRRQNEFKVRHVCQAFECGAILNPANLLSQVQGAIVMGLGAALREEVQFTDGKILNASFRKYRVPRFDDLPELDVHLVDRKDLPSAGAGETPIIVIAPAIANAIFRATGKSVNALPIQLPQA